MRIFEGFSDQISKVNNKFCSEITKPYIYEEKMNYFAKKT